MKKEFDFGFSAEYEKEFVPESSLNEAVNKNLELEHRLTAVVGMIQTLLNNLEANPEKELIRWPNRAEKIREFRKQLMDTAFPND